MFILLFFLLCMSIHLIFGFRIHLIFGFRSLNTAFIPTLDFSMTVLAQCCFDLYPNFCTHFSAYSFHFRLFINPPTPPPPPRISSNSFETISTPVFFWKPILSCLFPLLIFFVPPFPFLMKIGLFPCMCVVLNLIF